MGERELAPPEAIEISDSDSHREAWKQETDGIDRVISIALAMEKPQTASQIADSAYVSESTARTHLERLVELHVLSAVEQRGAKTYFPDGAYQRFRDVSRLVAEYDQDALEDLTVSIKSQIEDRRDAYDVESPAALRSLATAETTSAENAREYFNAASEWDSDIQLLSVAEAAFERYAEFTDHGDTANRVLA